ncbi:GNAT family N-acetyltransferase [Nocardia abscessus]|uniref:GNAT family N-acetyltransferase n=1 Tax=Nocardia abscessus TaxID=120957 RepID=UPI0024558501|nr:GNAT family N-acetyltransferase [Nocardia abscessus]
MSVLIRPRTERDLDACATALRHVHEIDRYPEVWPTDPAGWLSPPKLLAAVVAECDGAVVGHVGLGASSGTPEVVRESAGTEALVSVIWLYVLPAARRAGVGLQLLTAAARLAADRGQRAVLTVTSDSAAAVAMYERRGWRHVASGPGGWRTADGREAQVRYYVSP